MYSLLSSPLTAFCYYGIQGKRANKYWLRDQAVIVLLKTTIHIPANFTHKLVFLQFSPKRDLLSRVFEINGDINLDPSVTMLICLTYGSLQKSVIAWGKPRNRIGRLHTCEWCPGKCWEFESRSLLDIYKPAHRQTLTLHFSCILFSLQFCLVRNLKLQ